MRNVSDKSSEENQNTHFVIKNNFPKMWKTMVQKGRRQMKNLTPRLRIACRIIKAKL